MRNFFLLASVLCMLTSSAQKITDPRLKGLDTFALRVLKDWNAPGVSIAIVEKNNVIFAGGYGYRDAEKKLPVTAQTQFAIGSCTKAFTNVLLGMLVKEGKADLDKPINSYYPELVFYNDYTTQHATIRDLMTHRTGLPRHDYSWYGAQASRDELVHRIRYLEPNAALRSIYQYNNFMYLVLGMTVTKITGRSWEENIRDRILKPLNMRNTTLSVTDLEKSNDRALAYNTNNNKLTVVPYRDLDAIAPAGAINSCASDMANWLITWINGGRFEGQEIIPASYRTQAMSLQIASGNGLPSKKMPNSFMNGYGLGWGIYGYQGHYLVEHGGGIDGFISSTCFFPMDSIGIFVVSNQTEPTNIIREFISERLLGLKVHDLNGEMVAARKKELLNTGGARENVDSARRITGTKPSHALADYTGRYENKGYGIARLFIERDTLWFDYNTAKNQPVTAYLEHYHYDIFRVRSLQAEQPETETTKLRFVTGTNGKVESFDISLESSVKPQVFEKLPEVKIVAADVLKSYTGEYELGNMLTRIYLKGENTLMLFIAGQPDYELIPLGNDLFDFKILPGFQARFERNAKGEVEILSVLQPNGTFKAKRKK
ncbi:serine hydrolase [Nostoc ellipsosporum NOK]|nr:serine hydrolase [Nostoc ellipsosporum NOK]